MVLEVLVDPQKATGKPWEAFLIGALFTLVSVGFSYWMFRSYVSVVMVAFVTMAAIPFVMSAINSTEMNGKVLSGIHLFKEYGKTINLFTFLFLGFMAIFLTTFLVFSQGTVAELFSAQISAIGEVRSAVATGNFINTTGAFFVILINNLKVLFFCLLFSFFYGSGAIFILSWNASVMGVAIGDAMRVGISRAVDSSFSVISSSLAGYFVHGIPEIIAYFAGGLAGGILSVSLIREGFKSSAFHKARRDSLGLTAFAALILLFAALIEVFISPQLL